MSKVDEAKRILEALGLPKKQQNVPSALALLALCNLKEEDEWSKAKAVSMSVVGNKENAKYKGIIPGCQQTANTTTMACRRKHWKSLNLIIPETGTKKLSSSAKIPGRSVKNTTSKEHSVKSR